MLRMPRLLARVLSVLSIAGLIAALWTHLVAIQGINPEDRVHNLWYVQIALFFLLLPLAHDLTRNGMQHARLWFSNSIWKVQAVLLSYYAVHFYAFIALAAEHLRPENTWRMFSAGWILLFSLCVAFYLKRS